MENNNLQPAIPNPEPVKDELTYMQKYYTKNRNKWDTYNNFNPIKCDVCSKEYKFIKQHLKSNLHKLNLKIKQKDDLVVSLILSNDLL